MALNQPLPQGVTDLYAQEYELKQTIIDRLKQLYHHYGCQPIQTPTFEYYDLFMNIPGTMNDDQMIKLIDTDGKVLVLRPDATVPIARMASQAKSDMPLLNKMYYVTNIFRMESGESDRTSRSFSQVGVEWFDDGRELNDIEMVILAVDTLKQIEVSDIQLELGQAGFFRALMDEAQLDAETEALIQAKLEAKNEYELSDLLESLQVSDEVKQALLRLPHLFGEANHVLKDAKSVAINDQMAKALDQLTGLVEHLTELGYADYISIDLGLVNHLNYYTGVMFQGYVEGYGKPVIQGGRYDQLMTYFNLESSAIGFGVYIDDLLRIVKQQQTLQLEEPNQAVILTNHTTTKEAFSLAQSLRQNQIVTSIAYEDDVVDESSIIIDIVSKTVNINGDKQPFETIDQVLTKVGITYGTD
ncbi:ATP phosphoribosyltransferase regulatory subunit [Alkalibacillus flavidus]|uniref:ATP phosphoribosyltransferase regulatory subunit n=1 Tax=Alkalibacillus flavidus TaxID=546021 RepID=A0ABV2KZ00_9BACI